MASRDLPIRTEATGAPGEARCRRRRTGWKPVNRNTLRSRIVCRWNTVSRGVDCVAEAWLINRLAVRPKYITQLGRQYELREDGVAKIPSHDPMPSPANRIPCASLRCERADVPARYGGEGIRADHERRIVYFARRVSLLPNTNNKPDSYLDAMPLKS